LTLSSAETKLLSKGARPHALFFGCQSALIDENAATLAEEIATAMIDKLHMAELHCKASAR
jgi:hypothetical protein